MGSRSYSNLQDLVSGAGDGDGGSSPSLGLGKRLTRVMTVAGIISDLDEEEEGSPKPPQQQKQKQRVIVVGSQLPLRAHRRPEDGKWSFSWDEDSLLFQLRDGLGVEVVYVGCLRGAGGDSAEQAVEAGEQEEVSRLLLEVFRCVPAFVPGDLHSRFYHGFCKQHLWPLFHYMLPLSRDLGGRFDRSLWQAYVSVNKLFADKVMEVISPGDDGSEGGDFVWVHDYHLMLLPTFLRRRFNRVRLGFFLHSPFPSSEIYRTLPVRDELLRALLNADLIGFHTFDYARHFLSSCSRVLGLAYESKRGYISIDYYGRTVNIKILPVGVHMGQLTQAMALPETQTRVADLVAGRFRGKTVLLGVDDMDIFKGISLKLLAMEQVLDQHPEWRGKLVLVQVANPARGRGRDVQEVQQETYSTVERINRRYGGAPEGYEPIVLIDRPLEFYERVAYYAIAECCLVTAVRDGMNLIPYEYVVSRQGALLSPAPRRSMLVVSEFIGCSPSLSGAIRVNPWNVDAVAEAMYAALAMGDAEKELRHDKNYRYVSTHDAAYWARSFVQDLDRACRDHARRRCWGLGFGLGFRVIALDPSFRKLSVDHIVAAYRRANHRAILLDYDGTMHGSSSVSRSPAPETIAILNSLCRDPHNTVYLVGASGKDTLAAWFATCDDSLVLAAEHGYFLRQSKGSEWTTTRASVAATSFDFEWKQIAEPIMELYTEATDGSSMETKESGIVWRHEHADPDFGSCQAKELLDHLETVLANEPVSVKISNGFVEVKPQGVTKGLVAEQLLLAMEKKGVRADFVLFVGDDRSDEDMFEVINGAASGPALSPVAQVFACTVGQKPSKAKYYLEDTAEIIRMLQGLAHASDLTMVHQPASSSRSV